jgi:hypothetical protein
MLLLLILYFYHYFLFFEEPVTEARILSRSYVKFVGRNIKISYSRHVCTY